MKKKIMASLLVGSAVVSVSLTPLSAQAVTTGNTPVQVELEGGSLPDGNGTSPNTERPDPDATNSNFDLLYIPTNFNFGNLSISDDLTQPIPNQIDEGDLGTREAIGVGDIRGTKEGWHLTAQSTGLALGTERLQGNISVGGITGYEVEYYTVRNEYYVSKVADSITKPDVVVPTNWTLTLGGDAQILANASVGKGQGLWQFSLFNTVLNITTPYQQVKAGNYTGTVTWNLVAGPSI
jgi:hypothetical protein